MGDSGLSEYVQLSFFAEIGKAIASASTINETLKVVMGQIGDIFAPLNWSLLLRNPKTGELTFNVVIGSGVDKLQGVVIPKGRGIAGWIAENGQAIIIKDVANDKRFDSSMDQRVGFKTESIIGVPLKTRNRVFGVIELINKLDGKAFSPLELKTLITIADFTAIAIEKAYYYQALKKIALIDPLTGTNNRRNMIHFLEREIDRCHRMNTILSVLMMDIDKFKEINDNYGHVGRRQHPEASGERPQGESPKDRCGLPLWRGRVRSHHARHGDRTGGIGARANPGIGAHERAATSGCV